MKKNLLTLSLLIISFTGFSAEKVITGYIARYRFHSLGETKGIHFICLIPQNIEKVQKVINIEYSMPPERVFTKDGNRYAEFNIESVGKSTKLIINVDMEVYQYDFETIKQNPRLNKETIDPEIYLKEEKYISLSDNLIRTVAPRLKGSDTLSTLTNIHKFIQNNLTYEVTNRSIGADKVFKNKKGDCVEYSDLFVSLCRANNIPSRVVTGFVTHYKKNPKHAWAEVYSNKYGWIRFEPTTKYKKDFLSLNNNYIQLSTVRNDRVLNNNYFFKYTFKGNPALLKERIKVK